MRLLSRVLLAALGAALIAGCGSVGNELAGRWEGFTEGGYRFVLVLDPQGGGKMSKIGGPEGFPETKISWKYDLGTVVTRSANGTEFRWSLSGNRLVSRDSRFEVARSGPLAGYRYPLLAALIALLATVGLTPLAKRLAERYGAIDEPKEDGRGVHKVPTPRWGGLAIYAGILLGVLTVLPMAFPGARPLPPYLVGVLLVGTAVVAFGAWDDRKNLKPKVQMAYLLAAGFAVQLFYSGGDRVQIGGFVAPFSGTPGRWVDLGWAAAPLTALYIFVISKTMDTIDGLDGLAAGIAAIAASTLAVIAVYEGQPRVAIVVAAVAGASIGFLRHNFNPAKIFMGTGGAQVLGFLLACISIVGAFKTAATVAIVVPMLAFGVQLFDAFFVVVRRILNGKPITEADKGHIHHRLLEKGLTQRQAVGALYLVTAILCALLLLGIRLYG
ncbi:MAG: undecaprenyl/decaprenyl-phosphate alpha-N-acetylglucosaminyl 1-phosphate transferase [Fimbriimonadales bacterium]|nr:undecaprenyl/decaprenyl-phosphate alpha-N-acetylglucosaminyl 1-phosphate transferase [Fimbriimonadales bacterium]